MFKKWLAIVPIVLGAHSVAHAAPVAPPLRQPVGAFASQSPYAPTAPVPPPSPPTEPIHIPAPFAANGCGPAGCAPARGCPACAAPRRSCLEQFCAWACYQSIKGGCKSDCANGYHCFPALYAYFACPAPCAEGPHTPYCPGCGCRTASGAVYAGPPPPLDPAYPPPYSSTIGIAR